jgi:membrane-associated phospholipid phosphatase
MSCILFFFEKKESSYWINKHGQDTFDTFFKFITYLGDGWFAVVVILFLFLLSPKIKFGFYGLIAFVLTALITQFSKRVLFADSLRPSMEYYREFKAGMWRQIDGVELLGNNSFPSGHATSAFSVFCLLVLVSNNKSWGFPLFVLASLAAFSRVYLAQHFLEDVFVGSIIGCIGTLIIYSFLENLNWPKWANRQMLNRNS